MVLPLVPAALSVAMLWSLTPILNKYVMCAHDAPPAAVLIVSGMAYLAALACFAVYHNAEAIRQVRALSTRSLATIVFTSLLTGFVANLLFIYVLHDHDSYIVTSLVYSVPVFTLLLAIVVLHEQVTILGVVGSVLMLAGILCVALSHQ